MSSYLSKSKKEFKPKIGPRRSGAAAVSAAGVGSSPTPVRASVERQPSQLQSVSSFDLQQGSPPPTARQTHAEPSFSASHAPATVSTRDDPSGVGRAPSRSRKGRTDGDLDGPDTQRRPLRSHVDAVRDSSVEARVAGSRRTNLLPTPSSSEQSLRPAESREGVAKTTKAPQKGRKRRRDGVLIEDSDDTGAAERARGRRAENRQEHRDSDDGETIEPGTRKSRSAKSSHVEIAAAEADADPDDDEGDNVDPPRKKARRKRAATPDGAERVEITPTVVKMAELTKDMRLGKKSTREKRLQDKDREMAKQRKLDAQSRARQELADFMVNPENSQINGRSSPQTNGVNGSATTPTLPAEPAPMPTRLAPRVRVVNGQIVQDEDSRILDRHAPAAAERAEGEAIEEDELTKHVNSGSYMRRERHTKWNSEETERFYQGLRWFGTDFQTISQMFPGRTRRQIKLKFNKEERNPAARDLVRRALMEEREPADLAAFERYAQIALRDPEDLQADLDQDRRDLEAAQARETAQLEELRRQREADAAREAEAHTVALAEAQVQQEQQAATSGATKTTSKKTSKKTGKGAARATEDETEETGHVPDSNHDIIAGKKTRRARAPAKAKGDAATKGKGKGKAKAKEAAPESDGATLEPVPAPEATAAKGKGRAKRTTKAKAAAKDTIHVEPVPVAASTKPKATKARAPRAKAAPKATPKVKAAPRGRGKAKGKAAAAVTATIAAAAPAEADTAASPPAETIEVIPSTQPKAKARATRTKATTTGARAAKGTAKGAAASKTKATPKTNAQAAPKRVEKRVQKPRTMAARARATPAATKGARRNARKTAASSMAGVALDEEGRQAAVDALLRAAG